MEVWGLTSGGISLTPPAMATGYSGPAPLFNGKTALAAPRLSVAKPDRRSIRAAPPACPGACHCHPLPTHPFLCIPYLLLLWTPTRTAHTCHRNLCQPSLLQLAFHRWVFSVSCIVSRTGGQTSLHTLAKQDQEDVLSVQASVNGPSPGRRLSGWNRPSHNLFLYASHLAAHDSLLCTTWGGRKILPIAAPLPSHTTLCLPLLSCLVTAVYRLQPPRTWPLHCHWAHLSGRFWASGGPAPSLDGNIQRRICRFGWHLLPFTLCIPWTTLRCFRAWQALTTTRCTSLHYHTSATHCSHTPHHTHFPPVMPLNHAYLAHTTHTPSPCLLSL